MVKNLPANIGDTGSIPGAATTTEPVSATAHAQQEKTPQ